MDKFLKAAFDEAQKGLQEGGIPIGSVIVHRGKLSAGGITAGFSRVVPYCMAKWMP